MFLFQAEDVIRDLVRSRGLGDVYKIQVLRHEVLDAQASTANPRLVLGAGAIPAAPVILDLSLIHI